MTKTKGKGKKKEQQKRRRKFNLGMKPTNKYYLCIDGNETRFPVAYCWYHGGVLTGAMMNTHRCRERKCKRLEEGVAFD